MINQEFLAPPYLPTWTSATPAREPLSRTPERCPRPLRAGHDPPLPLTPSGHQVSCSQTPPCHCAGVGTTGSEQVLFSLPSAPHRPSSIDPHGDSTPGGPFGSWCPSDTQQNCFAAFYLQPSLSRMWAQIRKALLGNRSHLAANGRPCLPVEPEGMTCSYLLIFFFFSP